MRYGVNACPVVLETFVTKAVRCTSGNKFVVGSNEGLPIGHALPLDLITVKALHINIRWLQHLNWRIQRYISVSRT